MALEEKPNVAPSATMTFQGYVVRDNGIDMYFMCPAPGPGQASDYMVFLTDAEVSAQANLAQMKTLVTNKLGRKLRATGLAAKLDLLIGQSVVV